MALCSKLAFWTGGDAIQMGRLFRDSGLMRAQWDEVHFADGTTRRARIERLIEEYGFNRGKANTVALEMLRGYSSW